jgi:hypothetical protein
VRRVAGLWFSIEVLDGSFSASAWQETFGDSLVTEVLGCGAIDWSWHRHSWGVVFETAFLDESQWDRFQASLTLLMARDAAPDPISGVIVYRGRGGSAGRGEPRRPRPLLGSGAAALPLPLDTTEAAVFPAMPRLLTR